MKDLILKQTMRTVGVLAFLCLWAAALVAPAQEPEAVWPRRTTAPPYLVTLYEPQVESYDRDWMTARAAVSVVTNGAEPVFGAAWFGMRLKVNPAGTLAHVDALRLDQTRFPEGDPIEKSVLERLLGNGLGGAELPLAPLLASLARDKAEAEAAEAGNLAVPDILFTTAPVALVRIDGEPELKAVPDLDLLAVVNSNTPIFLQKGSSGWFMQVEGRWLRAAAVAGPWQDTEVVPESVRKTGEASAAPVVSTGVRPQVVVVMRPTEVICTDGEPRYAVIPGTGLLYVKNTDSDLFLDIAGQRHYALLAGRWFAVADPRTGPWEVVPGDKLPRGFALIPESSPKYGLLAHVPGTAVAQDAVQDAEVPRTQAVKREVTSLAVAYEGEPEFVKAGSTTVYYAVNTPSSVLRLPPYYYLCNSGVWYYGGTAVGPWTVCVNVPGAIYTIPPTCPVYPVTYVRVYDWTPDVVYCGYTSGYLGWYVGRSSLHFGLAYYDDAWWGHRDSRYYYHQNYRCGYYPQHDSYGSVRGDWGTATVRISGSLWLPPFFIARRPGPEYHMAVDSRSRTHGEARADWRQPPRPNRYDQEPSSALARRIQGNRHPAANRGPEGAPDRRSEHTDRTPPGHDSDSREARTDRTPAGRDSGSRDARTDRTPPERTERVSPERTDRTPAGRDSGSRDARTDRTPPERSERVSPERSERTTPTSQPLTRREPVTRGERGEKSSALTPGGRGEGRTEPTPAVTPPTPTTPKALPEARSTPSRRTETRSAPPEAKITEPAALPETRSAPPAALPETRSAPSRRTQIRAPQPAALPETRTAEPAALPEARSTPSRRTETRTAPPAAPPETRSVQPTALPEARSAPSRRPETRTAEPAAAQPQATPAAPVVRAAPAVRAAPVVRAAPAEQQAAPAGGGTTEDRRSADEARGGVPEATRRPSRGR